MVGKAYAATGVCARMYGVCELHRHVTVNTNVVYVVKRIGELKP